MMQRGGNLQRVLSGGAAISAAGNGPVGLFSSLKVFPQSGGAVVAVVVVCRAAINHLQPAATQTRPELWMAAALARERSAAACAARLLGSTLELARSNEKPSFWKS